MESTDRSIAAEARGVEENHQARLIVDADGPHIQVKSDSVDGRTYRVTAHASNGEGSDIIWTCKPSDLGQPGRRRDHGLKCSMDGTTPCKHMTRAARRLERAGLVRWVDPHKDQAIVYPGRWVAARATAPLVTDDLADAETPAVSGPVAEIAEWKNVPAITAAGMGIRSPWVDAMTTRRISPAERSEVRRIGQHAVPGAAYRQAMAKLTPADDALFASFANADRR